MLATRLWLAFAGLTVLLAGCAQPAGPGTPADEQAKATGPPVAQCDPGNEHWRSPGPPKRGGQMVRAMQDFAHLDPAAGGRVGIFAGGPHVYNALAEYRGCSYDDMVIVPRLARSWQVSSDGLAWTFKLRDDVRWHNSPPVNGRKFGSADVAWTIEYQKQEGQLGPLWREVLHEEPEAQTVVLRLTKPNPDFLDIVGHRENVIMPREVKEQHGDFKTVAVGTGALMLKEYKFDQEVLTERNPDYWEMGIDGKALPYLDQVRSIYFSDYAAEVAALRTGQIDHTRFTGLRKLDADAMRQTNPKLRYHPQLVFAYQALWFNPTLKPWDDVRVRRVAALALDGEELVASIGGAEAAVRSEFAPQFLKDFAWPQDKIKEKFRVDREQGRKLLAEAGYQPGQIKTVIKSASIYQQEAEVVQQHLAAIGIDARIDLEGATFTAILQKGDFELAWGARGGFLYANFWLGDFLHSQSRLNDSRIKDSRVDALIEAHSREMDLAQRKQLIAQLQDRLYEVMPFVPVLSNYYHHFASCRLQNYRRIQPAYNTAMVVEAWLDPAGC